MISNKKMSTKMNVLIYKTVVRPTLLYGCETLSMSVKDGSEWQQQLGMRMVRCAMMVMRRLEWFEKKRWNRKHQSSCQNEMEVKRPRGRARLRWKGTVRRDKSLTCQNEKVSARPATSHRKMATKG